MSRTLLPYSHVLESERDGWKPFRRALSKEDQQVFDRLFDRAKFNTHAGVYMARSWPMETILLSICLEYGKMIEEIFTLKEREGKEANSGLVFSTLLHEDRGTCRPGDVVS